MSLLNKYIDILNSHLKDNLFNDKKFAGCDIGTIAKSVYAKAYENTIVIIPGSIDAEGNEKNYSLDDTFSLQSYHKIISKTYSQPPAEQQFGNNKINQESISAYMVFFSSFGRIKITAEELEYQISKSFPSNVERSKINNRAIRSLRFVLQNTNFDSFSVFNREYQNVKYELGVEDILFSMQYQIIALINKDCLNDCEPCNNG